MADDPVLCPTCGESQSNVKNVRERAVAWMRARGLDPWDGLENLTLERILDAALHKALCKSWVDRNELLRDIEKKQGVELNKSLDALADTIGKMPPAQSVKA